MVARNTEQQAKLAECTKIVYGEHVDTMDFSGSSSEVGGSDATATVGRYANVASPMCDNCRVSSTKLDLCAGSVPTQNSTTITDQQLCHELVRKGSNP